MLTILLPNLRKVHSQILQDLHPHLFMHSTRTLVHSYITTALSRTTLSYAHSCLVLCHFAALLFKQENKQIDYVDLTVFFPHC